MFLGIYFVIFKYILIFASNIKFNPMYINMTMLFIQIL